MFHNDNPQDPNQAQISLDKIETNWSNLFQLTDQVHLVLDLFGQLLVGLLGMLVLGLKQLKLAAQFGVELVQARTLLGQVVELKLEGIIKY